MIGLLIIAFLYFRECSGAYLQKCLIPALSDNYASTFSMDTSV